jgi:hypothetical protein
MGLGLETRDGSGIWPLVPSVEVAAGLMDRRGGFYRTLRGRCPLEKDT